MKSLGMLIDLCVTRSQTILPSLSRFIIVLFLLGLKRIMSFSLSKSLSNSSDYLDILSSSLIKIHPCALLLAIASRLLIPWVNIFQPDPLVNPSCLDI
jgi:hypothetical protein